VKPAKGEPEMPDAPDTPKPENSAPPANAAERLAISVRGVSKGYRVYDKPEAIIGEVLFGKKAHREKVILHDINIDIQPGEVVGIIGRNGAGKSTLLKLIAGTLSPSTGKINLRGRVAAILELGTGFNSAYSGRDNVIMSAIMRGMSEARIKEKFDSIVEFAGLADVIDQPFHTYSSGMQARLAFAAAVAVDADVIIIDEALAAGDLRFTARSLRRVREICESGVTALFVSHQTYHVMQLCSRAIWIDDGRVKMDGPPIEVCRAYEYQMHSEIAKDEGRLASNVTVLSPVSEASADVQEEAPSAPVAETAHVAEPPHVEVIADSVAKLAHGATVEPLPVETAPAAEAESAVPASLPEELPPQEAPAAPAAETETTIDAAPVAESPLPAPAEQPIGPAYVAPDVAPFAAATTTHFQSNQYRITRIEMLDKSGAETRMFKFGESFRLRVSYECLTKEEPEVSCGLAAAFTSTPEHVAVMYFNTNYPHSDEEMLRYDDAEHRKYKGRRGVIEASIPYLQVKPGNYLVSLGILPNQPGIHEFYEYHHLAFTISVLPNGFPEPSIFYALVEWRNDPGA